MSYVDYVEKNNTVYNFTSKSVADRFDTTTAYAVGDIVYYEDKLYEFTSAHPAGVWNADHVVEVKVADEITDLKEALTDVSTTLSHKADKDGTVASAEQLLSDVGTEDKTPYLFRATPYDSTRVDEELVGCSVGWNQLVQNGNFADGTSKWSSWNGTIAASDGILTLTATSAEKSIYAANRNVSIVEGHKYYIKATVKTSVNTDGTKLAYTVNGSGIKTVACTANTWTTIEAVFNAASSTDTIMVYLDNTTARAVGDTLQLCEVVLVDTTAWFGSTIADYAITLEQATAGAGVAWIKALLPGGYIPYSAPTLKSVSGLSGHKFTGFNAFDINASVVGERFNTDGSITTVTSAWRSDYIRAMPETEYQITGLADTMRSLVLYFDANKTYIGRTSASVVSSWSVTTPSDCAYIGITQYLSTGDVYADKRGTVCCHVVGDGSRNGQYEPYKATTYALDSDLTLRGILNMDSDHNVYADGDRHLPDGTVVRRYGVVDLGTLSWNYDSNNSLFISKINDALLGTSSKGKICLCQIYLCTAAYSGSMTWGTFPDKYISVGNNYSDSVNVAVKDSAYSDKNTFATAMDGVYLVYELATPTTETALPYTSPQNCEPGGTEEYVYAEGGSGVPVGHNSKYLKNMRSELERVSVAVPDAPGQNGTYSLKATVTSSGVTYGWVAD